MDKHQIDSPQFMGMVKGWLKDFSARFLIKTRKAAALEDMLDIVMTDPSKHLKDDLDFVNYVNNFELNQFAEDFENYLLMVFKTEKKPADAMLALTHPKKTMADGKVSDTGEKINKVYYLVNELRQAAQAHDLSADMVDRMEQSVLTAVGDLVGTDISDDDFTTMLDKIHEIFSK
jgi:hypothetical protein